MPWTTLMPLGAVSARLLSSSPRNVLRRAMSMWPKNYEDPVDHKSMIRDLRETGDFERKKIMPVKAALADANCSVFSDPLVGRLQRTLMKYSTGEVSRQVMREVYRDIKEMQLRKYYKASEEGKSNIETNPTKLINDAVQNARPLMNLESVKVGAVTYSVPTPITEHFSTFRGIKWLIETARDRGDREARKKTQFYQKLARLLVDTAEGKGPVIAIKNEHHRVCEANRAYAHYRRSK